MGGSGDHSGGFLEDLSKHTPCRNLFSCFPRLNLLQQSKHLLLPLGHAFKQRPRLQYVSGKLPATNNMKRTQAE